MREFPVRKTTRHRRQSCKRIGYYFIASWSYNDRAINILLLQRMVVVARYVCWPKTSNKIGQMAEKSWMLTRPEPSRPRPRLSKIGLETSRERDRSRDFNIPVFILRHRKPSGPEALCFPSVNESVSLCGPKTSWTQYLTNLQWREFHPILVTDIFGFIHVLIRFWS